MRTPALLVLALLSGAEALAQTADPYADVRKKTALVVGIDDYQRASKLKNAGNDARLIARRFEAAGFTVRAAANTSLDVLKAEIDAFVAESDQADIATVYYAGHGVQIDGINYLIPADFDSKGANIIGQLYSVNELLDRLAKPAKARVIVLDACRDNPFLEKLRSSLPNQRIGEGLASIQIPRLDADKFKDATYGLAVGFATQPGKVASDGGSIGNSPFAIALDQAMANSEEDVATIFTRTMRLVLLATKSRQQPEVRWSLTGKLYFVSRPAPLQCDVLAAEVDNNVNVAGVSFDELNSGNAEAACRADLERLPNNPRLMHNLGRALWKSGKTDEAIKQYRKAAERGYDWAQNNLGAALLAGRYTPPDFREGLQWLEKASEQGNAQARVNYAGEEMSDLMELPGRTLALQKALAKAGIPDVPLTGSLDDRTLAAVEAFKQREGLPAVGITLQLIVKLGLVEAVFYAEDGN